MKIPILLSFLMLVIALLWKRDSLNPYLPLEFLSPQPDIADQPAPIEMKKIQEEVEQLRLAQEQQKQQLEIQKNAAAKRLRQLEIKKQEEIAQLQQQHQAELKQREEEEQLKEVEQIKLAQEQQKQQLEIQKNAAAEKLRRCEMKKQEEITQLQQQHQAELKQLSQNPQILMPEPKTFPSAGQLQLQDQLIVACKQGDEKTVATLLQRGAKPDMANARGEQPLGAAVWGMCPGVVNALLKQQGGSRR